MNGSAESMKITRVFFLMGRGTKNLLSQAGFTLRLLFESLYYTKDIIVRRREIVKQMYLAGVKTLLVCSMVGLFTGMILALQSGIEMREFGQQALIGGLVVASMLREMGPFMSGLILAASVGSAMAAEVGAMKVYDEIDALELMLINPVRFLVMPRVVALALVMPIISIYIDVLACLGGAIVAKQVLQVSYNVYMKYLLQAVHFKSMYVGLLKAFVFGLIVSSISCAYGLRADGGVLGVGHATRTSVVASFLMVLIIGYYITSIFYG